MEFVTGKCPKCSGELQVPQDREKIICMYCGEEIDTIQAVEKQKEPREYTQEDKERYQEYAKEACAAFPKMLFSISDPLKDFKKNMYEERFREYQNAHMETMNFIEDAYMLSDNPQGLLKMLAENLIEETKQQLASKKNKRQQEDTMMNYNMCMVIYLNPALLDYNKASGRPLVDELLLQWKQAFPKTNLKVSDFETINAGFKRRFCYITTAVCESLNKSDDCYELNTLRDYRDNYLQQMEGGQALIKRYYDIAPTIVKHINKQADAKAIYQEIWQDYLSPCIQLIQQEEKEECRTLYQNMVDTLAQKYFN